MVYWTVRLKVADSAQWRKVFDENEALRRAAGSTGVNQVFHDVDDANTITLIMEWDTAEKARAFMSDPALAERQKKAGSLGPPAVSTVMARA